MGELLTLFPVLPRQPTTGSLYLKRLASQGAAALADAAILALPGLLAWYSPRKAGLTADAAVSSIADENGGVVPAVQATGAAQPIYRALAINGVGALQFDGTNDFLQADALAASFTGADQPWSIYVVMRRATSTGLRYFVGMGRAASATPISGVRVNNDYQLARRDDANTTKDLNSGTLNTNPHVISAVFSGTTGALWVDGAAVIAAADQNVGTLTLDTLSIGALRRTTTASFFSGWMGDVVLCNAAHTTEQRQAVEAALGSVYGIVTG